MKIETGLKLMILVVIAIMFILPHIAHADIPTCPVTSGYCKIGFYFHWYNVTNVTWSYTNAFGQQQAANWTLVKFNTSSLGNVDQIQIQGYTTSLQNIGAVPFIAISDNFGTTMIEISKTAISGQTWNSALVFYDPTSRNVGGIGRVLQNIPCVSSGLCQPLFKGQLFNVYASSVSRTTIICNQSYYVFGGGALSQGCYGNESSVQLTPLYSNSTYVQMNFTAQSSFVVLTNRSMIGNYFNVTFNPSIFSKFSVNTTSTRYQLNTIGIISHASVSNTSVNSSVSNQLFGTFNGFEGYFGTGNQIISEGMSTRGCYILAQCLYNSLNSGSGLQLEQSTLIPVAQGYFSLKAQTLVPTIYDIIPVFSTTYNIANNGNFFTNNNPIINVSANSSLQGWYGFTNRTLIYGINWTYPYLTHAFPPNPPYTNTIVVPQGQTGYLLLNVTHYSDYGGYCNDVYFRAFVNGSNIFTPQIMNEDFGTIPAYPVSCSPNSTRAVFVLKNTTNLGDTYNSFYIYTDNTSIGALHSFDPSVYQGWQFASGNNLDIYQTTNTPFLIKLSSQLNQFSFVGVNLDQGGGSGGIFLQESGTPYNHYSLFVQGSGSYTQSDFTGALTTTFLVDSESGTNLIWNCLTATPIDSLFTPYLTGTSERASCHANVAAQFDTYNTVNGGGGVYIGLIGAFTNVSTFNGITAVAQKPYSFQYLVGQTQHISAGKLNCGIYCLPKLPIGNFGNVSTSKTGLNYTTNMTTIPFNGLNATKTTLTIGVSIPIYWLYIIEIIVVVLCAGLFEATKDGAVPFAIMTVAQWFLVLFSLNWTLLIIAVIVTLMFVIYEFTPHQKKEIRINKSHR